MQQPGSTAGLPLPRSAAASEGRRWVGEEREAARIETLRGFGILDTDPEQVFDELTELASQLCGMPMALISLVDTDRAWFKSRVGVDAAESPRDVSFCSQAIATNDVFVVRDATRDERVADNPAVTGDQHIRSYAGAPLLTTAGHTLGTLCVFDTTPQELTDVQLHQLQVLARQVVSQLELRRQTVALRSEVAARTRAQAMVAASERRFRALFEHSPVGVAECTSAGKLISVNPKLCHMLGFSAEELVGMAPRELLAELPGLEPQGDLASGANDGSYFTNRLYRRKDGSVLPALVGTAVSCDDDGQPQWLLATVVDMTAQVAAEDAARAARVELAERQVFTEAVLDSIDIGIVACDAQGRVNVVNRTVQSWFGPDDTTVPGLPPLYDMSGVPLAADRLPLTRILAEGSLSGAEMLITPVGQPPVSVVASGRRVTTPDGLSHGAVVALTDVTAARAQNRALTLSEARFRTTFENAPMGLAVVRPYGPALQVNPALCSIVGRTADELLAMPRLLGLAAPDDQADLADLGKRVLDAGGTTVISDQRLQRPDGLELWARITVTELGGDDSGPTVLFQLEDITDRRATEDRLTLQALYDPLTALPNRALLFDRATAALHRLERSTDSGLLVLFFLDLDGFKSINDTYGHAAGDHVLVGVANRISSAMRPSDTVARIGGDEFLVLCENVPDRDLAEAIAERLRQAVAAPATWNGVRLAVGASVGIALGVPGMAAASLVRLADSAMYQAKRGH